MKTYTASEYLIEHIKIDQTKRAFTEKEMVMVGVSFISIWFNG